MIADAVAIGRAVVGATTNGRSGRALVVTAEDQVEMTREAVPGVEILAEPAARGTAAAIGLAGALIAQRDPDAVIAVLPADQHVRDRAGMIGALDTCLDAAERDDAIALVGIPPSRPETGFGYVKIGAWGSHSATLPVECFVEKPDRTTAEGYLASGGYLWNAGIFCLTARRLLAELATHLPQAAHAVKAIARDPSVLSEGVRDATARHLYGDLPSVSFDHGVMEKLFDVTRDSRVVVTPAAVGWNDVGSWAALPEVRDKDDHGNTIVGQAVVIGGSGNVIFTDDGVLVATIGVSDLVVVQSGDAILVVPKDQAQRVREVVDALGARGLGRHL